MSGSPRPLIVCPTPPLPLLLLLLLLLLLVCEAQLLLLLCEALLLLLLDAASTVAVTLVALFCCYTITIAGDKENSMRGPTCSPL